MMRDVSDQDRGGYEDVAYSLEAFVYKAAIYTDIYTDIYVQCPAPDDKDVPP